MAYTDVYHNADSIFSALADDDRSSRTVPPPLPPRRPADVPPPLSRSACSFPQQPTPTMVRSNTTEGSFACSQLLSSLPTSYAKSQTPTSPNPRYNDTQTTPPPLPARRAPPLLPPPSRQYSDDVDSGFSTFSSSSSSNRTTDLDGQSTKSSEGDCDDASSKRTRKSLTVAAADFHRQLVKIGKRMTGGKPTTSQDQVRRTSSDEPDYHSGGSNGADAMSTGSSEKTTEKFNYRQSFDDLRQKVATPISSWFHHQSTDVTAPAEDGNGSAASFPKRFRRKKKSPKNPNSGSYDIQQAYATDSVDAAEADDDSFCSDSSFDEDVNANNEQSGQEMTEYGNFAEINRQAGTVAAAVTLASGQRSPPVSTRSSENAPQNVTESLTTPSYCEQLPKMSGEGTAPLARTQLSFSLLDFDDITAADVGQNLRNGTGGEAGMHKESSYEDLMHFDRTDDTTNSVSTAADDSGQQNTMTAKLKKALLDRFPISSSSSSNDNNSKPSLAAKSYGLRSAGIETQHSLPPTWQQEKQIPSDVLFTATANTINASAATTTRRDAFQPVVNSSVQWQSTPSVNSFACSQLPSKQSPLLPHRPLPPVPTVTESDDRHIPTNVTPARAPPIHSLFSTNSSTMDTTPTAPPPEDTAHFLFNQQTWSPPVATIQPQIDLHQYAWYFGTMNREICENQLRGMCQNGAFIVRQSQRGGANYPYAISVYHHGTVYHLLVRLKANRKYALGTEKANEQEFETMAALVTFHRRHAVYVGVDIDGVLLTASPAKLS